jgi:hypothetical protein
MLVAQIFGWTWLVHQEFVSGTWLEFPVIANGTLWFIVNFFAFVGAALYAMDKASERRE